MQTAYLEAAMRRANYELLAHDEGYFGAIPELPGVWAQGDTQEEAANDLCEALEGRIALALHRHIPIPELDGVGLPFQAV